MANAFIALGTNLGDRKENIKSAIAALNLLPFTKVVSTSNIYETAPWGYMNQENFLNAVVKVQTDLSSKALLGALLGIEAAMGRVRTIKNGPRIIDLDLLIYEDEIINTKELVLPHPRMDQRAFVLAPLLDVLDEEKYKKALEKTDKSQVIKYEA